jgi:hypothetical protein
VRPLFFLFLFRVLAPDDEYLADRLHGVGGQPFADLRHPGNARVAVAGRGLHLDELVRLERPVHLGEHRIGETLVADDDDGAEGMGLGTQFAAAGGGELGHGQIMTHNARTGR